MHARSTEKDNPYGTNDLSASTTFSKMKYRIVPYIVPFRVHFYLCITVCVACAFVCVHFRVPRLTCARALCVASVA